MCGKMMHMHVLKMSCYNKKLILLKTTIIICGENAINLPDVYATTYDHSIICRIESGLPMLVIINVAYVNTTTYTVVLK